MRNLSVGYTLLKQLAEARQLRYFHSIYGSEGGAYIVYAMGKDNPTYTLSCDIRDEEAEDFEAIKELYSTEVASLAEAQAHTASDNVAMVMRQDQRTNGHYELVSVKIPNIPAGQVRYVDIAVPDLSAGWDWVNGRIAATNSEEGDQIVSMKMIGGRIGSVAAPASTGDILVSLAAPIGVLRSTARGGAIDEGFYLSFGAEASTATTINNEPTGPSTTTERTWANPIFEIREYRIRRIGHASEIGGGYELVTITLFTPLEEDIAQNTEVNVVSRALSDPYDLAANEGVINIGGSVLQSGNIPANRKLRAGYFNNGAYPKTVRGGFEVMY